MLGIKRWDGNWDHWWLGSGIPESAEGRVVTFQADGDELNLFLNAMAATSVLLKNGIFYTKMGGFQIYSKDENERGQKKTSPDSEKSIRGTVKKDRRRKKSTKRG